MNPPHRVQVAPTAFSSLIVSDLIPGGSRGSPRSVRLELLVDFRVTSFSWYRGRCQASRNCVLNSMKSLSNYHHTGSSRNLLGTDLSPLCAYFLEKIGSVFELTTQNSFKYLSSSLHLHFCAVVLPNFDFLIFQHLYNFYLVFIKIHIRLLLFEVVFFYLNHQVCSLLCLIVCSQLHISFRLSVRISA